MSLLVVYFPRAIHESKITPQDSRTPPSDHVQETWIGSHPLHFSSSHATFLFSRGCQSVAVLASWPPPRRTAREAMWSESACRGPRMALGESCDHRCRAGPDYRPGCKRFTGMPQAAQRATTLGASFRECVRASVAAEEREFVVGSWASQKQDEFLSGVLRFRLDATCMKTQTQTYAPGQLFRLPVELELTALLRHFATRLSV